MVHLKAYELEQWAARHGAPAELPRLIRRLIRESCRDISRLDMPGGEHVYLDGFDGIVSCGTGNQMVPSGVSAWELSTNSKVTAKANADYKARTANTCHLNRATTSFVFATPRRWRGARKWEDLKNSERTWQQVHALWSSHLEQWLEQVPWVASSFARGQGLRPTLGLRTIEAIWDDYADVPLRNGQRLPADFVLSGRDEARNALLNWLIDTAPKQERMIRVIGSSEREVLDFIAACIYSIGGETAWERLGTSVFAITDPAAADVLQHVTEQNVLIACSGVVPHVTRLSRDTGCRVIFIVTAAKPHAFRGLRPLELPPMPRGSTIRALIGMGHPAEEAVHLVTITGLDYEQLRHEVFGPD